MTRNNRNNLPSFPFFFQRKKPAAKKKEKGSQAGDEDEDAPASSVDAGTVPFMSVDEMKKYVVERHSEMRENQEFVDALVTHLRKPLTRQFQEVVRSVFLASTDGKDKRKEREELQEQFS